MHCAIDSMHRLTVHAQRTESFSHPIRNRFGMIVYDFIKAYKNLKKRKKNVCVMHTYAHIYICIPIPNYGIRKVAESKHPNVPKTRKEQHPLKIIK